MDIKSPKERNCFIELESGMNIEISGQEGFNFDGSVSGQAKMLSDKTWSNFDGLRKNGEVAVSLDNFSISTERPLENRSSLDERSDEEEKVGLLEKKMGIERSREKARRKPSKPPRPPRSPSLDAADRKLVREISELAMLKRARIERMKNMKNGKAGSSSSNLCALVVTIIFCALLIWQGVFSKGSSNRGFHGSPESSLRSLGQFHKNLSSDPLHSSSGEQASGLNDHGEADGAVG